jgi:hypothetical protein
MPHRAESTDSECSRSSDVEASEDYKRRSRYGALHVQPETQTLETRACPPPRMVISTGRLTQRVG